MHSSGVLMSSLLVFDKKYAKRITRKQLTGFSLYLNSSSQSYKGNELNCCWVEMSSKSRHRSVLSKTKSSVEFFQVCKQFLYWLSHSSPIQTFVNFGEYYYVMFPNICIISPLKAYFDYFTKPLVKINNIFSIGPCYCPCSVRKIVAT